MIYLLLTFEFVFKTITSSPVEMKGYCHMIRKLYQMQVLTHSESEVRLCQKPAVRHDRTLPVDDSNYSMYMHLQLWVQLLVFLLTRWEMAMGNLCSDILVPFIGVWWPYGQLDDGLIFPWLVSSWGWQPHLYPNLVGVAVKPDHCGWLISRVDRWDKVMWWLCRDAITGRYSVHIRSLLKFGIDHSRAGNEISQKLIPQLHLPNLISSHHREYVFGKLYK